MVQAHPLAIVAQAFFGVLIPAPTVTGTMMEEGTVEAVIPAEVMAGTDYVFAVFANVKGAVLAASG